MDEDKLYTDDSNNPQADDAEPKEVDLGDELGDELDVDPELLDGDLEG